MHGSSEALSVASDAPVATHHPGAGLIPSISCRSTVSDTEYENVSLVFLFMNVILFFYTKVYS